MIIKVCKVCGYTNACPLSVDMHIAQEHLHRDFAIRPGVDYEGAQCIKCMMKSTAPMVLDIKVNTPAALVAYHTAVIGDVQILLDDIRS